VRALRAFPRPDQVRIAARIDALSRNPRPPGNEKLKGDDGLYRVRQGDYRIIYTIKDAELLVLVITIGNRRDVYRRRK
jgi:mRNA interferase RelE/StbE